MKALLKLVETYEDALRAIRLCDARGVRIVHKKYGGAPHNLCLNDEVSPTGELQTYFSFNHGGYGSSISLREGANLLDNWRMEGAAAQVPNHKQLTGTAVCFVGTNWERDLKEQRTLVTKRGGQLKDKPGKGVDVLVVGKGADRDQSAQTYPDALVVTEERFQRVLPKPRSGQTGPREPRKRVARLGKESRKIYTLLSARDYDLIDQGLQLLTALGDASVYDELLADVGTRAGGELLKGKRFEGTKNAQPFLDYALCAMLSQGPSSSRAGELRATIKRVDLIEVMRLPSLRGFNELQSLELELSDGHGLTDLKAWEPLPSLETLSITSPGTYGRVNKGIGSLAGLVAPSLHELTIWAGGMTTIPELSQSPRLTSLDLSQSKELEHIDGLSVASDLRTITLDGCASLTSIAGIANAANLEYCSVKMCSALESCAALANKPALQALNITNASVDSLHYLVDSTSWQSLGHSDKPSDTLSVTLNPDGTFEGLGTAQALKSLTLTARGLTGGRYDMPRTVSTEMVGTADLRSLPAMPSVTTLTLSHPTLTSLAGLEALEGLKQLTIQSCPRLVALDLPDLPNLEVVRVHKCATLSDISGLSALPSKVLVQLFSLPALTSVTGMEHLDAFQIAECEALSDLSGLAKRSDSRCRLKGLRPIPCDLSASTVFKHLNGGRSKPLDSFTLHGCSGLRDLTSLGPAPRPGIEALRLPKCTGLTSLDGIACFVDLRFLDLRGIDQALDVSALVAMNRSVVIAVGNFGLNVREAAASPGIEALFESLKAIPNLYLSLDGMGALHSLDGLETMTNLRGFELCKYQTSGSGYYALNGIRAHTQWPYRMPQATRLPIDALRPLVPLPLEVLALPETDLPPRCGAISEGTNKVRSINNFRVALSKALGLPAPSIAKAKKRSAPKGMRSALSKIRKLLLAPDISSIQQGIALLEGFGMPEVWDALVAKVAPETALVAGEGKAAMVGMGSVFSRAKVSNAVYARWALLQVLVTAPDEALEAVACRRAITEITLNGSENNWRTIKQFPSWPSLAGFSALDALSLCSSPLSGEQLFELPASLRRLVIDEAPELRDLSGVSSCPDLAVLRLQAGALESLDGIGVLKSLERLELTAPRVTTLSAMRPCTALRHVVLRSCGALTSLDGLQDATQLGAFEAFESPSLTDLSALSHKPLLGEEPAVLDRDTYRRVPEEGVLDLGQVGPLHDLRFLEGATLVKRLRLLLDASVDLSPLATLGEIDECYLTGAAGIGLTGLERTTWLSLELAGAPSRVDAMPALETLTLRGEGASLDAEWPTLSALRTLTIKQPLLPSVSWLDAPELQSVNLEAATLDSLAGIGHAGTITNGPAGRSNQCVLHSLDGLEGNARLTQLNLGCAHSETDLSALKSLPNLEAVKFEASGGGIGDVGPCPAIQWLKINRLGKSTTPTSVSFLTGWDGLTHLILLESGLLTNLEVLATLPKLEVIHLRGSKTKRNMWPDELQDKLDFTSGERTYRRDGIPWNW